jgi:GAF domain-containing protein
LVVEVVNQIQTHFDYYHAHIYLFDEQRGNLVVVAGTGLAGAKMIAQGHHIPLEATSSLVALAARSGQTVSVDNVREAEDWLPNPLLPNTYSEMAVPITLGVEGEVVGVLDVQEDKIGGLDEGDVSVLRSLAGQVAVAIRNARLFDEVQTALTETRELQQRYIDLAWDRQRVARRGRSRVQFSLGESITLAEDEVVLARQEALTSEEPHLITLNHAEDGTTSAQQEGRRALVAPILLQGRPIGNLQLHEGRSKKEWNDSELALIRAVIDQVAQTAENIRLVESVQERASREQLINQISAKLRRVPDLETLLEVGTTELAKIINPARTFVRFGVESSPEATAAEEKPEVLTSVEVQTSPVNGYGDHHE